MTLLEGYQPKNPFVFFNDETVDRKVSQKLAENNKNDQSNSLNCNLSNIAILEKRTNCSFHKNTSLKNLQVRPRYIWKHSQDYQTKTGLHLKVYWEQASLYLEFLNQITKVHGIFTYN